MLALALCSLLASAEGAAALGTNTANAAVQLSEGRLSGVKSSLQDAHKVPEKPVWPAKYHVAFKFYTPYVAQYQDGPLEQAMEIWRDSDQGLQRIVRGSTETWIEHAQEDLRWYRQPSNFTNGEQQEGCLCENMSAGGGPSRRLLGNDKPDYYKLMSPALPSLDGDKWSFAGILSANDSADTSVQAWHYHVSHDKGYGIINIDWFLYVTADGVPKKLEMFGINWFTGGHWDHYIADFTSYKADPDFDDGLFEMPKVCKGVKPRPPDIPPVMGGHHLTSRLSKAMRGIVPNQFGDDAEYDAHVHVYGRRHAHQAEYDSRREEYYSNKRLIEDHNAGPDRLHTLGLNQFADWTHEEYRTLIKSGNTRSEDSAPKPTRHNVTWPLHMLPATVDWRGTDADSRIKDQSMCGSCWAFAAVSPMETAYYRQYGELKLLSEQYIMDCSWPYGNNGCNGGFQDKAFRFVLENGGIPANNDYPYTALNEKCKKDVKLAAAYKSYVAVDSYEKEQLKEALLTKGPMTVSISADDPGFKFYQSGIFYAPNCTQSPYIMLDHAVMLSGYGRDSESGRNYWILKNIWSTFWGEQGYMRIDMDNNDCGVTALPQYTELDVEQTDKLRAAEASA